MQVHTTPQTPISPTDAVIPADDSHDGIIGGLLGSATGAILGATAAAAARGLGLTGEWSAPSAAELLGYGVAGASTGAVTGGTLGALLLPF